jgi:hypothetical protein
MSTGHRWVPLDDGDRLPPVIGRSLLSTLDAGGDTMLVVEFHGRDLL